MVGYARAIVVEVLNALVQRFDYISSRLNGNAGHLGQFADIVAKALLTGFQRLVWPESGQHAEAQVLVLRQLLVVPQVVNGIVGGADYLHVEAADQVFRAVFVSSQQGRRSVPYGLGGFFAQYVRDAEYALQLQMGPVVQRIADHHRHGLA